MIKYLLLLFLLIPVVAFSQVKVAGQVIDITTKKPVPDASVFITNTTIGTKANDNGKFTLYNVKPGSYQLVVSIVSHETYSFNITAGNTDLDLKAIEIVPRSIALNEVKIKPDPNWEHNYMAFKRAFVGRNVDQCKILNPKILDLHFDVDTKQLTASSYDFLIIENAALGYRIKYLLQDFVLDNQEGYIAYKGLVLFEDLKGNKSKQRKWQKARLNAFMGSSQHFLRAIIGTRMTEEGFKVLRLIRTPNKLRPPDSLIKAKLSFFRKLAGTTTDVRWGDSIAYWANKSRMPKVSQTLVNVPLQAEDFVRRTDQPGMFALKFKDFLYVIYTKKKDDGSLGVTKPMESPDHLTSVVNFKKEYALFDYNGVLTDTDACLMEGAWGFDRVGDLLPVDYEPPTSKN